VNHDNYGDLNGDPTLDPRHYRFARTSDLPRGYFPRRRTAQQLAVYCGYVLAAFGLFFIVWSFVAGGV
jgi:hypothetical protein